MKKEREDINAIFNLKTKEKRGGNQIKETNEKKSEMKSLNVSYVDNLKNTNKKIILKN